MVWEVMPYERLHPDRNHHSPGQRSACQLSEDELNLLGVTLTQLGDTLLTMATCKSICCKT